MHHKTLKNIWISQQRVQGKWVIQGKLVWGLNLYCIAKGIQVGLEKSMFKKNSRKNEQISDLWMKKDLSIKIMEKSKGKISVALWPVSLKYHKKHKMNNSIYLLLLSCSAMSDTLWPLGLQHARLPLPSPSCGVWVQTLFSQWHYPTISSSVTPVSSSPQSFPASGSFPMSLLFASGGQGIGVSALASVLLMNIQDWIPLGLTGLISLLFIGLLKVFFSTTVRKH